MTRVRLASFNLLHGSPLPPPAGAVDTGDGSAYARAVRALDADVLGLQEVDRDQPRSGSADQTAVAARALGASDWRFAATLRGTPGVAEPWTPVTGDEPPLGPDDAGPGEGPTFGIGLVSRLPVRSWHVRRWTPPPFSVPLVAAPPGGGPPGLVRIPDEPRALLAAVVELPGSGTTVTVATTHLSFVPGWNGWQLLRLVRALRDLPAPRFVLGDLNLPGGLPRALTGWHRLAKVATYPSYGPRMQFDHALTDTAGLVPMAARAVPLEVSDHCAVVVDLAAEDLAAASAARDGEQQASPRG